MIRKLKEMGFKVTVWTHPFINFDCPSFQTAFERNYFVRDTKDKPAITSWWVGGLAGVIDFSNVEAVEWWKARLDKLREKYGIDSFKFDAGEYDSLPASVKMAGDANSDLVPNSHTTKYVETVSKYGGMIEVRVGRHTQKEGIFARMIDKDSRWGYDNGLQSLIPTLFHFSMLGYSFCLPDMIGGNAYDGRPSKELYIRWMQANVLMPAVQMSIVPWEFDNETVSSVKDVLAIRETFSDALVSAARQSVLDGTPMNRPMWFADPEDPNLYAMDHQYMLGDNVIVAPVLTEGATTRDVYLPRGRWSVRNSSNYFTGPLSLANFPAPLDTILIFVRT
jgi:alpha-glucosidase (family GH31 glycosyl hydrolase)